tara:strand:+ start:104 stop:772 length:669 start_codon:yes stop_codon:yes gene_type:complete
MVIRFIYIFLFITVGLSKAYTKDFHKELLDKLETLYPIEINFQQINNNETVINGWMILGGKGLARTEFAPPNNLIIVADGRWVIFHDALYDRTTYLPINRGLFQALLNPSKFDNKKNLKIFKNIIKDKVVFKISFNQEGTVDELLIFFDLEEKSNLLGWEIFKNNVREIKVIIKEVKRLKSSELLKSKYFNLSEDIKKQENQIFKGPYQRKFKKIPNHGKPK